MDTNQTNNTVLRIKGKAQKIIYKGKMPGKIAWHYHQHHYPKRPVVLVVIEDRGDDG